MFAVVELLERDLVMESDGDGSYAVVRRGYQQHMILGCQLMTQLSPEPVRLGN